jgi:hypothetical protein
LGNMQINLEKLVVAESNGILKNFEKMGKPL